MAKIHFVGINGVGINALAKFAADMGFEVSGSDAHIGNLAREIKGRLCQGEDPSAVESADVVVPTLAATACAKDNVFAHPELARAAALFVPIVPRKKMLGEAAALFERSVAVAGTHGKTTVTAMLTHILFAADAKFVAMIGGESVDHSNYVNNNVDLAVDEELRRAFLRRLIGESTQEYERLKSRTLAGGGIFVTEACEYMRSFLEIKPYVGIVTNVEYDHPDCYASIDDVRAAFDEFLDGCRIKIVEAKSQANEFAIALIGPGLNKTLSLCGKDVVMSDGKKMCELRLAEGGEYNLQNAMFAIGAAYALGIDAGEAAESLCSYAGVKRRFERAKDIEGTSAYFDFAHHPTEIACALDRAAAMGRTLIVFQPHTFSRTKAYLDDFAKTLGRGDCPLVLLPTYAAREPKAAGVDVDALAEAVKGAYPSKRVLIAADHAEALEIARRYAKDCDVIMFVGAGDIYSIKDMI